MATTILIAPLIIIIIIILLSSELPSAKGKMSIKAAYWAYQSDMPATEINIALFTHIIFSFATINTSSFELSVSSPDATAFSKFTNAINQNNPSISTLLSIKDTNYSTMASSSSGRKTFISSTIKTARLHGFQGIDFWLTPNSTDEWDNIGSLFQDWRAAIASETANSSRQELILTASVYHPSRKILPSYPLDSMRKNLDWVHVMAFDNYVPTLYNTIAPHAALYDPNNNLSTDLQLSALIYGGLSADKLVLGQPLYGYAWTLAKPSNSGIGAPSTGPAVTNDGFLSYKDIKKYLRSYGARALYASDYVVNYCSFQSTWIGFDGVEAVRQKVSYAKKKGLLGYAMWEVSEDDNWELSKAADQMTKPETKWVLLVVILATITGVILLPCLVIYCIRMIRANSKGGKGFKSRDHNLRVFSLATIEKATGKFSAEKKLGEGGYGPVYKGVLPSGQEIAVKKLSRSSKQGFLEFKNEVTLTAQLQHVNLVKLLGYCVNGEDHMLVYEYMPKKSLDYYLFDSDRKHVLDWGKRVAIIEGITQGLLYLQEYSRLTIIHRDLKSSNILLDNDMKPKISDLGLARIFEKDAQEANTSRIVGTPGFVPPEYVNRGVYSTKLDVYSFGILLLQIISGKKNVIPYGSDGKPSLQQTAYELWKNGKGRDVLDTTLDDTSSSCKLMKCLQVALLCVQEHADDRPSMLAVYSMLKNETAKIPVPKEPAFSPRTDEDNKPKPLWHVENVSVDDATISEVIGR